MSSFKTGIQLYTVREPLQQDFEGTLKKLSDMGIEGVELAFFYGGLEPDELAALMKKLDLQVIGIYEKIANISDNASKVYDYIRALNCKYLTCGIALKEFQADLDEAISFLKGACATSKANGITLCYHAHSHEFQKIKGKYIMDIIMEEIPDIAFEADTAWIKCGGDDPANYIKKYLARIPLVHFKDVKADKDITELGNGIVDFPSVLKVIENSNVGWVSYEQDRTTLTPLESTEISLKYLRKITGAK